jgi:DNA helicase HerA-like ATPase
LNDGGDVFPGDANNGTPLSVIKHQSSPPQVIDIAPLPSSLKRFVVAAVMKQVNDECLKSDALHNLSYLIMLDELNRFAPRDSKDAITRLLEEIALEGRSRGVILLGSQQFASQVSAKIVESAAIRVCGRCGAGEMGDKVWKSWGDAAHEQASNLQLDEKLVTQPTFRSPMLIKLPHPAWAMRKSEIGSIASPSVSNGAPANPDNPDDDLPQS